MRGVVLLFLCSSIYYYKEVYIIVIGYHYHHNYNYWFDTSKVPKERLVSRRMDRHSSTHPYGAPRGGSGQCNDYGILIFTIAIAIDKRRIKILEVDFYFILFRLFFLMVGDLEKKKKFYISQLWNASTWMLWTSPLERGDLSKFSLVSSSVSTIGIILQWSVLHHFL